MWRAPFQNKDGFKRNGHAHGTWYWRYANLPTRTTLFCPPFCSTNFFTSSKDHILLPSTSVPLPAEYHLPRTTGANGMAACTERLPATGEGAETKRDQTCMLRMGEVDLAVLRRIDGAVVIIRRVAMAAIRRPDRRQYRWMEASEACRLAMCSSGLGSSGFEIRFGS